MRECPKCGSGDRLLEVRDSAYIHVTLKVKGNDKKFIYREKLSKRGRLAKEELLIDKKSGVKVHRVKEMDERGAWITVHEERAPLQKA
jgi:hypothetical protein